MIASTNPEGGGPIEGVKQRGAVLKQMGHVIEIACLDDPTSAWLEGFPFKVHALGPGHGGYGFAPDLLPWLRSNAGRYDGVVVNGIWQYHALAARRAMQSLRRPYVVFTHGMLDPWFKRTFPLKHLKKLLYWFPYEYWNLRRAAAVLFTTEEERVLARESFWPYRVNELVVNYGTAGPPEDVQLQLAAFHTLLPDLQDQPFLLFLSRIHPKKGCDLLIRAFAVVVKTRPELSLVIAGPDQVGWRAELEGWAAQLGVSDRVYYAGMLKGDQKWGAYRACEAFVLPSHQENFGIVVAEALACGKPVLISNKVNIWREVQAAGAGLVGDDTLEGTTDLLTRWADMGDEQRADTSKRARRCFDDHFEITRSAQSLLGVLEGLRRPVAPMH